MVFTSLFEKLMEVVCIAGENVKGYSHCGKYSTDFSKHNYGVTM
jgi:hypothetical protein